MQTSLVVKTPIYLLPLEICSYTVPYSKVLTMRNLFKQAAFLDTIERSQTQTERTEKILITRII